MAKRVRKTRRDQTGNTSWWLIGALIFGGIIVVGALMFLALREPGVPS